MRRKYAVLLPEKYQHPLWSDPKGVRRVGFWDRDVTTLNVKKHQYFIIPRHLYMTTTSSFDQDMTRLETYYPKDTIIYCLQNTKVWLFPHIFSLTAKRYGLSPFETWHGTFGQ
ncbi:MAG: hypothetical protein OXC92_10870 [Flavobacteriaceae bacterium]|nr:hypothetical protein [Flavobacteriaceae bacterium]MCY4217465.1 hypothetical protein [Flavobacteriaceae bacterium]MCY4253191.1 hypothetical protein [Flavobacteriaceae bacterium]